MGLYHYQLGFPKGFSGKVGTVVLQYGAHALRAANEDRYGLVNLPKTLNTSAALCVEVELLDGAVIKLVYRVRYSADLDLVLAVSPKSNTLFVRTVWLQSKNDTHATLDLSRYDAA
jgi:hypothetical protein